ncbi:MAG: STAS domain-containing protein [Actinomycetota bacterium]|nr:STAS domain-containing protein [Actinomycetota bacterium]
MSALVGSGARARTRVSATRRHHELVGLSVVDDGEGTVTVTLDGAHLAQGLVELRRCALHVLPGGTDTLRIDLRGVDHLSSVCVATLLRVKRVCVARRIHLVLDRPTGRGQSLLVRTGLRDVLEAGVVP